MPRFENKKQRLGPAEERGMDQAATLDGKEDLEPLSTGDELPDEEPAKRILIAGAGGSIGFPLLRLAVESGYWVRTLSKSRWRAAKISLLANELWLRDATEREAIRGVCRGVDIVVSCLGGSLDPRLDEKRSFAHLDFEANRNLLAEAIEAKVSRFVYVSVFTEKHAENTAYVRAHRRFEKALEESGIDYTILRFAGLPAPPDSLLAMARTGSMPLVGRSDARVNPIHPEDAAQLCLEHLESGPQLVEAGGPEIYTRRELSEMVFSTVGNTPSFYHVPTLWLQLTGGLTRLLNPRRANLIEFLGGISRADMIAPRLGTRSVADYLRDYDGRMAFLQEPA